MTFKNLIHISGPEKARVFHCLYIFLRNNDTQFKDLPYSKNNFEFETQEINNRVTTLSTKNNMTELFDYLNDIASDFQRSIISHSEFYWLTSNKKNKLIFLHAACYLQTIPRTLIRPVNISLVNSPELIEENKPLMRRLDDTSFESNFYEILNYFDQLPRENTGWITLQEMRRNGSYFISFSSNFKWLSITNEEQISACWDYYFKKKKFPNLIPIITFADKYYAIILGCFFSPESDLLKISSITKMRAASNKHMRRIRNSDLKQCNFEISKSSSDKLNKMKKLKGMNRNQLVEMLITEYTLP